MVLVSGSRPLMMLDIRMLPMRLALGIGFSCLNPGQLMLLRLAICRLSFTVYFTLALRSSPNTSNRSPLKRCSSISSIGW